MTREELLEELKQLGHHLKKWAEPSSWREGEEAQAKGFSRPLKATRVAYVSIRGGSEPLAVLDWLESQMEPGTAERATVRGLIERQRGVYRAVATKDTSR